MKTKRYSINWYDWDVVVEIDHDIVTDEKLHAINNFWTGADDRLCVANESVLDAVLCSLAERCFQLQIEYGYTTKGLIGLFSWTDPLGFGPQEGWPNMDGTDGFKLILVDTVTFSPGEMTVQVLA